MPHFPVRISNIPTWIYRLLLYIGLLLGFGVAAAVLALRYWLLPNIEAYRTDIAEAVSNAARQRVTIGSIGAGWEGLRPHLSLGDVTVYDAGGRPALFFHRVENTLSWWSLASGELRFHTLEIEQPQLNFRRDAAGNISIAGIALNQPDSGSGFADWMLRQRSIVIRGARIDWNDEQRQAPPLVLSQVNLRLENSGTRHRFGLHAVPPAELAAPLDVRGDLVGRTVADWVHWRGTLYGKLDYADLAAWRPWLPFPVELRQGRGALRSWLEFEAGAATRLTADLSLSQVQTRLAGDLPELELDSLRGRLGWVWLPQEFTLFAQKLSLATREGIRFAPTDFSFELVRGAGGRPNEGELNLNVLDLGALTAIADHLPLPHPWCERLRQAEPHGTLREVTLSWRGTAEQDRQLPREFGVHARFSNLGMRPLEAWPGFSGVSGEISGDESNGKLIIDARSGNLDLPKIFEQPLPYDVLAGEVTWKGGAQEFEYRLRNVVVANSHLAGSIGGSWRSGGSVDLTGKLSRADARQVWRYLPLAVSRGTRDWVHRAIIAGQSNDVQLRLKGKLADFPYADPKLGVFQVKVKGTAGVLDYASGWPRIENIDTDLLFSGKRMDILAHQATLLAAKLHQVKVAIPDLESFDEQLQVEGQADGATADFLKFIELSPVTQMIGGFTEGMAAEGHGKLALRLNLPLRRSQEAKLRGEYQFFANRITPTLGMPPLEQVSGMLEFSESMVRANNLQTVIFGGPASINAATAQDGNVRVAVAGRANFDNLAKTASASWWSRLHGTCEWRGSVTVRKNLADVLLETNLRGVASELPAPFGKSAGEAMALRFEKKTATAQQDRVLLNYGGILSAQLLRRKEADGMAIERGAIVFGGAAPLPAKRGLWVSGALPAVDLGRWRALLAGLPQGEAVNISGIDVQLGALDIFGQRFDNVRFTAAAKGGEWQGKLAGGQIGGEIAWQPQGKGKIAAHMKQVALAPATQAKISAAPAAPADDGELPALDVVVENLQYGGRALGKLELAAAPDGRDWLIDKLRLQNADGTLTAGGLWQSWVHQPRTQLNVKVEVNDIGKFLARFGMPEGIKGGSAKLAGPLSWAGAPQRLDYPTLSGELELEARRGQFAKLEPGLGKLLGVLSLQSLPRRVTLDFKDIFSEGLAFEEIAARVKIERGIMSSDDFTIFGPAAKVTMSGTANLSSESQNLRVKVIPTVGEGVSVAGALIGGPVAGITAFIVQKMLQDPLGQLVSYEYQVTGTWAEPVVKKISVQPAKNQPAAD